MMSLLSRLRMDAIIMEYGDDSFEEHKGCLASSTATCDRSVLNTILCIHS